MAATESRTALVELEPEGLSLYELTYLLVDLGALTHVVTSDWAERDPLAGVFRGAWLNRTQIERTTRNVHIVRAYPGSIVLELTLAASLATGFLAILHIVEAFERRIAGYRGRPPVRVEADRMGEEIVDS